MKKFLLLPFCLLLTTAFTETTQIKVMTYNIRHACGMDNKVNIERIINVIKGENPDILILNEVDEGIIRSGYIPEAKKISEALNMDFFFFPTEGRKDYGNAVLSKHPIVEKKGFNLPQPKWMNAMQRGCASIIITINGKKVNIMGVHLGLGGIQEIETELGKVLSYYNEKGIPGIVAGDFNIEYPDLKYGNTAEFFKNFDVSNKLAGKDLYTFPSDRPGSQIDYICISHEFKVIDTYTVNSSASDHLPVVAILEMNI